jgi:hypothetical protein
MAKAGSRLDLDHYLEALVRKPGALPGATALEQARAAGRFTPVHDAWWAAARKAHGDAAGTRALIETSWPPKLVNELVEAADEKCSPKRSPATDASISYVLRNSAIWNSTNAAPSCCSKF